MKIDIGTKTYEIVEEDDILDNGRHAIINYADGKESESISRNEFHELVADGIFYLAKEGEKHITPSGKDFTERWYKLTPENTEVEEELN